MRIAVGYPSREEEQEILRRRRARRSEAVDIAAVVSRSDLIALQQAIEEIHVEEAVEAYAVDLVRATRAEGRVALGASPRGSLAIRSGRKRAGIDQSAR